jgi:hypothetical protein
MPASERGEDQDADRSSDDGDEHDGRQQADCGGQDGASADQSGCSGRARHLAERKAGGEGRDLIHTLVAAGAVSDISLGGGVGGRAEDAEERASGDQQDEDQDPAGDPAKQRRHGGEREEEHRSGKAQHADGCDLAPSPRIGAASPVGRRHDPDRGGEREDRAGGPVR